MANVEKTTTGFKVTQSPKVESLEEKIVRLEKQVQQDNIITFEVLATIFEELLELKMQLGGEI